MSSAAFSSQISHIKATDIISKVLPPIICPIIGTHDGHFHCDEALATALLKMHPKYSNAVLLRTRNPEELSKCDIVVDVGAVYDPSTNRFDHHQREFTGVLDGYNTKLSSAGLVYKHFGKEIIRSYLGNQFDETFIDSCFKKTYEGFIEHIDAIDNGISICDGSPRYHISSTLSSRVGRLNPEWNQPQSAEIYNRQFKEAMALTVSEFLDNVFYLSNVWWPARTIVQQAISSRNMIHPSGKIIVLETSCPWKEHLFELENELGVEEKILYALYPDTGGSWRIQAVPENPTSFASRKALPEEWRGVRDEDLAAKIGVEGAIFVHASGFIGGHKTINGAISMASQAVDK